MSSSRGAGNAYDSDGGDDAVCANLGHTDKHVLVAADTVVALNLELTVPGVHGAVAKGRHAALDSHVSSRCDEI